MAMTRPPYTEWWAEENVMRLGMYHHLEVYGYEAYGGPRHATRAEMFPALTEAIQRVLSSKKAHTAILQAIYQAEDGNTPLGTIFTDFYYGDHFTVNVVLLGCVDGQQRILTVISYR